jgi:hypothetical protein
MKNLYDHDLYHFYFFLIPLSLAFFKKLNNNKLSFNKIKKAIKPIEINQEPFLSFLF